MNMKELLRETPEYTLVKEFNLSERMLKEFNNDTTIVFDTSTWKFKVISINNFIRAGVYEVFVVPKDMVNDAIINFLHAFDGNLIRRKYNTRYQETQNIYKRFEAKKKSEVYDHLKRIRMNMGERL